MIALWQQLSQRTRRIYTESVYTEESLNKLSEAEFYERFGVGSVFFGVLLDRLKEYREKQRVKGERPNRLSVFQSLVIFSLYMTQTILADIMGVKNGTYQERIIECPSV